jgi:hypothetical protein
MGSPLERCRNLSKTESAAAGTSLLEAALLAMQHHFAKQQRTNKANWPNEKPWQKGCYYFPASTFHTISAIRSAEEEGMEAW